MARGAEPCAGGSHHLPVNVAAEEPPPEQHGRHARRAGAGEGVVKRSRSLPGWKPSTA